MRNKPLVLCAFAAAALAACAKRAQFIAPALEDAPVLADAALADIPVRVPAYGLALKDGRFEVNVEAADAKRVRPGQAAIAFAPGQFPIACLVSRVLPVASAETGQALAWLTPTRDGR